MNTAGWLLTESGRQPWIVQGLMKTVNANSPSVTSTDIWISLIAFVLIYIALGAADLVLMLRYARKGLDRRRGRSSRAASRAGTAERRSPALTLLGARQEPMHLHTIWFVIIAIFWVGFFVLEGFDFGVGDAAHDRRAQTETERRVALNTIGPWWDGNEVWLIVAGAGHVRRVPRLVRDDVLGAVPGAAARARGADGARRGVRVQRQERGSRAGGARGRGARRSAAC